MAMNRSGRRGLALVEAALLIPLLLALLIGLLEYGWLFYKLQQVNGAARHGARIGVVAGSTQAGVQAAIDQMMADSGLSGSGYAVAYSADPGALLPGNTLTVTVTVPYANIELTGFPLIPVPTNLVGETSMVKEGIP